MEQQTRWAFGAYELDCQSETLLRNGQPVHIGRQAFRGLALLVSRGGGLVSREELQKHVWGDGVHVDFEHGLNVCIRQIRLALGEDADGNKIVVTCPREGYRLGVRVTRAPDTRWSRRWRAAAVVIASGVAGSLLVGALIWTDRVRSTTSPAEPVPASAARFETSPSPNLAARPAPGSPDAYSWYWRGSLLYDRAAGRKLTGALPFFEKAIEVDPSLAVAQAGLTVSYLDRAAAGIARAEFAAKARQAAQRALAIGDDVAEVQVALAELSYRLDGDARSAERSFSRALALDSRNAYVHHRYAVFLRVQGQVDEALEQLRIAQELDPLSVRSSWQLANTLFLAHRYEESLAQAYRTLELDASHPWSFRTIGQNLEAMGKLEEAVHVVPKSWTGKSGPPRAGLRPQGEAR